MIVLLLKITLVLALALAIQPLLKRSSAATRHLVCVFGLAGALLLPFTLLTPLEAGVFRIGLPSLVSVSRAAVHTRSFPRFSEMAGILWIAGSTLLLLRIALGYVTLARLLRKATPACPAGTVPVFFADISVPVVSGLVRPVILLPRAAEYWPLSQRNAALNHELQHVVRKDLWTTLAGHLACAAYWFHPLVWLIAGRLRQEQESACDDAVLVSGFDPASYAEALVAAARQLTSTTLIGCHMLTTQTLKSRIARLFEGGLARTPSRSSLRIATVASLLSIAVVGMLAAADDQIYKVGNGVTVPKVLYKVDPEYSEAAQADKIAGTVTLQLVIEPNGLPSDITVVNGLGEGLDEKAVEAVQQWHFEPGTKDGEPVRVRAIIEINFRLK
jgi:TonB family protein